MYFMKCQVIWSKRSNSETFDLCPFLSRLNLICLSYTCWLSILPFSIVAMKLSNNKISKAKLIFPMMISSSLINVNFVAKEIIINLVQENLLRRKKMKKFFFSLKLNFLTITQYLNSIYQILNLCQNSNIFFYIPQFKTFLLICH